MNRGDGIIDMTIVKVFAPLALAAAESELAIKTGVRVCETLQR